MGILLDAAVILIVVFFVIISAKKGFVLTFLDLCSYIISLVASMLLSKYLATLIFNMFIKDPMTKRVEAGLTEAASNIASDQAVLVAQKIPNFIVSVFSDVNSEIAKAINSHGNQAASQIINKVIAPVITALISVVIFFILFTVLLIFLKWVSRKISMAFKLPMVRQINSTLGGILGFFKGVVIVLLLMAVFAPVNKAFTFIQDDTIKMSIFAKHIYYNNPVEKSIGGIFDLEK